MLRGSCLCGGVRYEIDGPLSSVLNCHCDFDPTVYGLPLEALDGDPGEKPKRHEFVAYKAPWHDIADDLPQFAGLPR